MNKLGINKVGLHTLMLAKRGGIRFGRTVTLGVQGWHIFRDRDEEIIADILATNNAPPFVKGRDRNEYLSELLSWLGFISFDSIDASDYEGATIIHDLNNPISSSYYNQYDFVLDAGSLEHIFNVPVAFANIMRLLRAGGHFIGLTPANNYVGHGFYQFSPELFYRVFSAENGFDSTQVFLCAETGKPSLYRMKDPKEAGLRQEFNSTPSGAINLIVVTRKISDVAPFKSWPQQSDYVTAWQKGPLKDDGH